MLNDAGFFQGGLPVPGSGEVMGSPPPAAPEKKKRKRRKKKDETPSLDIQPINPMPPNVPESLIGLWGARHPWNALSPPALHFIDICHIYMYIRFVII